ncbi:integrase core domain-containing protein [Yersinia pseudotuberculosis]
MEQWRQEYNHFRPHSSLKGSVWISKIIVR